VSTHNYAMYKFNDYTLAKRIPNVAFADRIFDKGYSEPAEYLDKMYELVESMENDTDFVSMKAKPLSKLTFKETNDLYKAFEMSELFIITNDYLLDLLFFCRYKDNFVKVISEADDNFSEDLADIWLD